jgi:hypothetical protein
LFTRVHPAQAKTTIPRRSAISKIAIDGLVEKKIELVVR